VLFGLAELLSYFAAAIAVIKFPRKNIMIFLSIAVFLFNILSFNL
jgi:hypothetical protein